MISKEQRANCESKENELEVNCLQEIVGERHDPDSKCEVHDIVKASIQQDERYNPVMSPTKLAA